MTRLLLPLALVLATLLPVLSGAPPVLGQTCTIEYVGPTEAPDNLWSMEENWSTEELPTTTDTVCHMDGGIIQCDVGNPDNPATISQMFVSGADGGGLTIGGGLTDLRGLKITGFNGFVDLDNPPQDGGYDVLVRAGSLLQADIADSMGGFGRLNITLEAGSSTNLTKLIADDNFTTVVGNVIDIADHTRFEVGRIFHNSTLGDATFSVAGSDAIVTVTGQVQADIHAAHQLVFTLDDEAQFHVLGEDIGEEAPLQGGEWYLLGESSLSVELIDFSRSVDAATFNIGEGSVATFPDEVFASVFVIHDTGTTVIGADLETTGNSPDAFGLSQVLVADGASVLCTANLNGGTWVVEDAVVGDPNVLNAFGNPSVPNQIQGFSSDWTITGSEGVLTVNSTQGGTFTVINDGRMVLFDHTVGGFSGHSMVGGVFSIGSGGFLEAATADLLLPDSLDVDDATAELRRFAIEFNHPFPGLTVADGAQVTVVEDLDTNGRDVEYSGADNQVAIGDVCFLDTLAGFHSKIRKVQLGSSASLTLSVAALGIETDLSEPISAGDSWDTSGVTLGIVPPTDPEMADAGETELINVLWDVGTAEPLIFCDTHTNKWAGFVVKEDATANLADGNFNGYYGTLYSSPEVLNVLGNVSVADGAELNTDGRQIFYTGTLTNDGSIDNTSNLVQVEARHYGDFNADGLINNADFDVIRDSYSGSGNDTDDPRCDSDGDNDSDNADYAFFVANRTAYGSDSLCSGGESFAAGGGSGCSAEVALTEEQEAWVSDTIAWCVETLPEELIAATAEAFAASTAHTADPAECLMASLVAAGLAGE